jgi:hypothetical protein
MNNPLYEEMQKLQLEPEIKADLSKWFAWERMGGGILCHFFALPMGSYEDSLLSSLRRGEYPKLTRYEGLGSGLFSGGKADITAALKVALANKELPNSKDILQVMPKDTFSVDPTPEAIAFYNSGTVSARYEKIAEAIIESPPKGLKLLNQLMNAHLHNTWQNIFSDGIAVLKPLPEHMTAVIEPGLQLAQYLAQCPESPVPASCPPNRDKKCKKCISSNPLKITTPAQYRNTSTKYTIGTLPHPYTLLSLNGLKETIDIPYIRRNTARDQYLAAATKELLGTGVSSAPRLVKFKEAVASPYGSAHSIWFIAEMPLPDDLDWYFGFVVPRTILDSGKSETPVPGPERRPAPPPPDPQDGPAPDEKDLPMERPLLEKAKTFLKSKRTEHKSLREAVEMWNLGDIEAWRFARAFLSRSKVERQKWEEEEKKYAGGAGADETAVRQGWGRWFDRL